MFKTALRISALLLIVAGAFYCGRASRYAKSSPIITESPSSCFEIGKLYKDSISQSKIEFALSKHKFISDESPFQSEIIETPKTLGHHVDHDLHYALEYDATRDCLTYCGEKLPPQPPKEIFTIILGGFTR